MAQLNWRALALYIAAVAMAAVVSTLELSTPDTAEAHPADACHFLPAPCPAVDITDTSLRPVAYSDQIREMFEYHSCLSCHSASTAGGPKGGVKLDTLLDTRAYVVRGNAAGSPLYTSVSLHLMPKEPDCTVLDGGRAATDANSRCKVFSQNHLDALTKWINNRDAKDIVGVTRGVFDASGADVTGTTVAVHTQVSFHTFVWPPLTTQSDPQPTGNVILSRFSNANCTGPSAHDETVTLDLHWGGVGGLAQAAPYTTTTTDAVSFRGSYQGDDAYFGAAAYLGAMSDCAVINPSTTPGDGNPGAGATPELNSLLLLASGVGGLAGYGALRLRAGGLRRRR